MGDILKRYMDDAAVTDALTELQKNNHATGTDGVNIMDLDEYIANHNIIEQVINDEYTPRVATNYQLLSSSGKMRDIYRISVVDKLILKLLQTGLCAEYDYVLAEECLAYRAGKGTVSCINYIRDAIDASCKYVVKIDIDKYFDRIPIDRMLDKLHSIIQDAELLRLIQRYLNMPIECNFRVNNRTIGLIQGSSLSPFLSNLYLTEFDKHVTSNFTQHYYRYADDINIFCPDEESARECYDACSDYLTTREQLALNKRKSGIFPIMSQTYLGYSVIPNDRTGEYEILRLQKDRKVYNFWHSSGLKQRHTEYDIISNGILTYKDTTLLFESGEEKVRIPVNTVRNINIFANVNISGNILKHISDHKINLTIFDKYGNVIGRFVPENSTQRADTFLKQASAYNDETRRLELAAAFVEGEIFNMRANLQYYRKHSSSQLIAKTVDSLKQAIREAKQCESYTKLLLIEARAKDEYYSCYNDILPGDDFYFAKRTRRPPEDAINALISFGNTVLYNYIANEIAKTSLNVKIGYLHATNKRAESLNLDFADVYKPVITDRVIFTLINKQMIHEYAHFNYEKNKVWLTQEGKRIFLSTYYRRMDSMLKYKGEVISYREIIWRDIQEMLKCVQDGGKYTPFHYII